LSVDPVMRRVVGGRAVHVQAEQSRCLGSGVVRGVGRGPPGEPGTPTGLRPADIYQGMGIFSSWPVAKRYELIQDCLDILIRRHVPAIISYINKREYAEAKANELIVSAQVSAERRLNNAQHRAATPPGADDPQPAGPAGGQVQAMPAPSSDQKTRHTFRWNAVPGATR